ALGEVIPRLEGPIKKKARDALVERLTQMTAKPLRSYLGDDNAEIRQAAALACGMKDDKEHIPDLIAALEDTETMVVQASRRGLKDLTREDFGPVVDASRAERTKAVAAWKEWWRRRSAK